MEAFLYLVYMDISIEPFARRLFYLQQWINLSVDNRVQELMFAEMLQRCRIARTRFPPSDWCIYQDFEGFSAALEKDWEIRKYFLPSDHGQYATGACF